MTETTEKAILAGGCFWGCGTCCASGPASSRRALATPAATSQRDLSPRRHAEAIEILFDPSDLPRTRVLARTPTQLTLLRLGDLDRLTSHDSNVRRGYDNSSSPRRTYFREPVLAAISRTSETWLV
jgi:hypothetical protein